MGACYRAGAVVMGGAHMTLETFTTRFAQTVAALVIGAGVYHYALFAARLLGV